jgi:excisionase family DNA binding protein
MDTLDTLDSPDGRDRPDSHDNVDMSEESWLRVMEVAQQLGVSERQVRRYIKNRQLPVDRTPGHHGPQIRIRQRDVELLHGRRAAVEQATDDTPHVQGLTASRPAAGLAALDIVMTRLDALYRGQLAAKDAEIAAREALAEELCRRAQEAESERDTLRLRVRALEATVVATEPVRAPNSPTVHDSVSPAQSVEDRDEALPGAASLRTGDADLRATIAAKAAAIPEAVTQAYEALEPAHPEEPLRQGLLARLFRRRSIG